ncbi:Apolipoprotein L6 [Merluccius polli]|uniref:Apolipoprotein L6 n=1 Tax=Merluccius polli TaxID=89951 RepID=A0AA47MR62_MERPO|nr:Apolipoprotein L6 [Merluccius polli]
MNLWFNIQESNQPEEGISTSCENLSETTTQKEKKAGLYGLFKRSASIDNLFDNEEKGGLFGGLHKKTPKATGDTTEDKDGDKEITASNDSLSEGNAAKEKSIFGGIFKKPQKPTQEDNSEKEELNQPEEENLASCESLSETTTQKDKSIFSGIFKKQPKAGEGSTADEDRRIEGNLSVSCDDLSETAMFVSCYLIVNDEYNFFNFIIYYSHNMLQEKTGGLSGMFKRSPKPAQRSQVITDPLHDTNELDERDENLTLKETHTEMSASNDSLNEASTTKEKKRGLGGIFRRTPKTVEQQDEGDLRPPEGGSQLKRRKTITKRKRVVSFRVKRTLPRTAKSSDLAPLVEEESVEMQEMTPIQEGTVEIQPVEMASYSTESNSFDVEEDDELMEWWNGVVGWAEWNETSNFQEEDEEMAVEQAADRLYMAARLFVRIFNQRGASLQQRILELLAQADAADQFHKRTVSAAVGGGVASVAGSVATITGLILAPFTFGASIIVTAVGISVATAGSIASATANITDAVHSNMDRKKVEKMIQGYQDEIKDISECLEFVQEGMNTLQEWDFEKYSQSAAKKALNHNIKHVMKEGGRAGKALVVKTNELISTVQVLSAAGGAAKAVKAVSVTTGVMSALFLALDVFFLAKDSHELRKGAKTKFAKKIREVCKDLQDGLLELNKVKSQLQKTMDGIELEEVEEILEVEEEVEEEEDAGDMLKSDPIKLAKLYEELDIIEEKLDKKVQEDKEKKKEEEESSRQSKEKAERKKDLGQERRRRVRRKRQGAGGEQQETNKKEEVKDNSKAEHLIKSQSEPEQKTESVKAENATREASWKEPLVKGGKKAKEAENRATTQREHTHSNQAEKADVMPTHEGRKEKGEVMAEDHGNGKIEKEKDSGRSWLGGHRRRGGEEAKSGPKSEQQKGRSEEQLSVEPKESGVKRHSSSHNRHSSSSGRSQRDRATGYDAEAREGHQQNRGDGSNRQDDDPTASRRKTEREGQRAEVRGGDAEVRRRESDESRGGMSGTSQHRRTQRHSALDLDVGGGGRGSSQREKRGSRTKSERSVESGGGEEGVRREDGGESGQGEVMRGGSTREPTRQGSRSRANAVLSDGLDI